ncbi:MAG: MFS transporter [Clostridia bacterium]|nr:MFS transporter [Clostridia bacterium]
MKTRRLTKKEMWIFAIGQLGWSILGGLINAWLVTFYLPTSGDVANGAPFFLPTGLIIFGILTILGLISFICRIFDAVTDPLIASLSDRSKNPNGRRIPFMRRAAIPFAVIAVLVFCAPVEAISTVNIIWVLGFLILFYLFMTMYCTPYNALISEFGKTQEDRMYISTAISATFFAGTLLSYIPFVLAPMLRGMIGASFPWSYRICFIVLAVVALICMLIPTFKLKERDFVDAQQTEEKSNTIKSLIKTFKNKEFLKFSASDIAYFIALTLFQTGLPFFVKVSMNLDESWAMYFLGGMTVLSACFYPIVSKLVAKFGKKKLVITGFIGLALAYVVTALIGVVIPRGILPGILIVVISAFPMALLGIIPQSIIADVAEEDAIVTGEKREGMFFAARTFAMKMGQSVAALVFTSLAILLPLADANIKINGKTDVVVNTGAQQQIQGFDYEVELTERGEKKNLKAEDFSVELIMRTSEDGSETVDPTIARNNASGKESPEEGDLVGSYLMPMNEDDFKVNAPEGATANKIVTPGRMTVAKDEKGAEELRAKMTSSDLTASRFGLRIVAIVAVAFCLLGALILAFYKEKKVMGIIEEAHAKENLPE